MKIVFLFCLFSYKVFTNEELFHRIKPQVNIASKNNIIDGKFIIVGNRSPKGRVIRERKGKEIIYRFIAQGDANRIEFNTCFATKNVIGNTREVNLLKQAKNLYSYDNKGDYGEIITYEWQTRFPEKIKEGNGGIFCQVHGRPDRTLVKKPNGELEKLTLQEFSSLLKKMSFKKNVGIDKKTQKKNNWFVDNSSGGPIAAFHIRYNYIYLMIRSDANRISNPNFKLKPKPRIHLNKIIGKNGKYATIVFQRKTSMIPINKWINFKLTIKYTKYSPIEDKVITEGYVKMWINNNKVVDWKGNIGKNDELGPFFKFGIYKPRELGFKVDFKNYRSFKSL